MKNKYKMVEVPAYGGPYYVIKRRFLGIWFSVYLFILRQSAEQRLKELEDEV